jgi:AcrR family transcriptional regulator
MVQNVASGGKAEQNPASAADQTRLALIRAGLRLFGGQGYDATSTREIAAASKSNIGSIAYHFGGKEGLRAACAEYIVDTIRGIAGEALGRSDTMVAVLRDPDIAAAALRTMLQRLIGFATAIPEAADMMQFILREMARPTSALDTIYSGVFEPVHKQACAIWAAATGDDAESERTRVQVFTLIGQVVYFRVAREAVRRRMDWQTVGAAEIDLITKVAIDNVSAVIAARRAVNGH